VAGRIVPSRIEVSILRRRSGNLTFALPLTPSRRTICKKHTLRGIKSIRFNLFSKEGRSEIKALTTLLVVGMFLTSVAMADDAHDVDSNAGKSGYLNEPFFLFQMNSNNQLLQWDSDLGQVISRKSPADLPFTLKFSRQQPEPEQLGAPIVPVPLAIRDFRFVQLRNNSSLSPGLSWYSFPTASMATFPQPQGTPPQSSPQKTFNLSTGIVASAFIGVGVYLMATSEKQWFRDSLCLFCPPCTSEEQPGCDLRHGGKMAFGILSTVLGAVGLYASF